MTWEGSIMLSHALTFSLSPFTPSSICRQAGTEMQRQQRRSQLVIHSDTGQRPLPHSLLHKRMHSGGKCLWHWGFAANTDDIQGTSILRKTFIVSSRSWMKSLVHTTQPLYHKSIFLAPKNIFKTWFVKLSNIYNEWLPDTIILFPLFAGDFWVSANTSLWSIKQAWFPRRL